MSIHNKHRATTGLSILKPEQQAQWMDALEQSCQYDFYHLPQYHGLAEEQAESSAILFVYREGAFLVAIPLVLRPMGAMPCHQTRVGEGWYDATCVYGYAGPIASHSDMPESVLRNFQAALRETLLARRVVAVFSRLHPLISQRGLLADLGECIPMGQTVSIDLTLPIDVQRSRYRNNHKRDINKLGRLGATCLHDENKVYLDEFVDIYYETMRRVDASEAYFFERTYFERLTSVLEPQFHLFVCSLSDTVVCGGLFALCEGIVQYHLGGTRNDFLRLAPLKFVFETVRLWANECKARVFHLGGGVGAQEDPLFQFKAGFSDQRHEFAIWRWVLLPDVYETLCQEKAQWGERYNLNPSRSGYFPAYRCPDCPCMEFE
jgi:hypothetical protein